MDLRCRLFSFDNSRVGAKKSDMCYVLATMFLSCLYQLHPRSDPSYIGPHAVVLGTNGGSERYQGIVIHEYLVYYSDGSSLSGGLPYQLVVTCSTWNNKQVPLGPRRNTR